MRRLRNRSGLSQLKPASSKARNNPTVSPGWRSANWSGYAINKAKSGSFRSIAASWTVPRVKPSAAQRHSSAWIGIDGFGNPSLIQTGTEHEYRNGKAVYYAWWEILPAPETRIHRPVSPGDRMYARISKLAGNKWRIRLANRTKGWVFDTVKAYTGPASTAEWVLEAPTINGKKAPLANYGKVKFRQCRANGINPRLQPNQRGVMVQNGRVVSTPSLPNRTTDGFSVAYGAKMPKPPNGVRGK